MHVHSSSSGLLRAPCGYRERSVGADWARGIASYSAVCVSGACGVDLRCGEGGGSMVASEGGDLGSDRTTPVSPTHPTSSTHFITHPDFSDFQPPLSLLNSFPLSRIRKNLDLNLGISRPAPISDLPDFFDFQPPLSLLDSFPLSRIRKNLDLHLEHVSRASGSCRHHRSPPAPTAAVGGSCGFTFTHTRAPLRVRPRDMHEHVPTAASVPCMAMHVCSSSSEVHRANDGNRISTSVHTPYSTGIPSAHRLVVPASSF